MAFALTKDRIRSAIDTDTNATMVIRSGPQMEFLSAKFNSPETSLDFEIAIRPKFADRPIVANDPENPSVMIMAGPFERAFRSRKMQDVEANTRLVEYLIRMIAFINKHNPLSTSPFFWGDYEKLPEATRAQLLYRMPSGEELLRLSSQ